MKLGNRIEKDVCLPKNRREVVDGGRDSNKKPHCRKPNKTPSKGGLNKGRKQMSLVSMSSPHQSFSKGQFSDFYFLKGSVVWRGG